ncbi:ATP-binding protein [bacterium]|nr:ATP-binding protein [bacterium]
MRLRTRLAAYFFLVIAVAAGTTLLFVRGTTESLFRSYVFSGDSEKAKIYASILGEYYDEHRDWTDLQSFLSEMPRLAFFGLDESIHGVAGGAALPPYHADSISALLSDRIAVADSQGVIVADTAGELLRTIHPAEHLAHGVPIVANGERVGTALVGSMVDSSLSGMNERFLGSITQALLWAVSISAGLALFLGLALAAQVTRPVAMLTRAARKVAAGDLSAAVKTAARGGSGDEIAELSESFNVMTEELKRLEDAKKQIIADSAHELRTPVTLIQGTIEAMIDGVYPLDIPTLESVHEETVRLARLIDTLRELEIIQSGKLSLHLEPIDCEELLRRTAALFTASAKEKDIALTVDPTAFPPSTVADRLRVGEVIYNLVSNAIKYTPKGGTVRLRVESDEKKGQVYFQVDDSGPGIPADERERIFERFYRIDKSRSTDRGGRGLGLAIASEIAKAHGGSLAVGDSDLGGASFVLTLKSA